MALIASDRRTLIVGLGETGLACVRHCHGLGRSVSVVDSRNQPRRFHAWSRRSRRCRFKPAPLIRITSAALMN